jgi:hypothetical protein
MQRSEVSFYGVSVTHLALKSSSRKIGVILVSSRGYCCGEKRAPFHPSPPHAALANLHSSLPFKSCPLETVPLTDKTSQTWLPINNAGHSHPPAHCIVHSNRDQCAIIFVYPFFRHRSPAPLFNVIFAPGRFSVGKIRHGIQAWWRRVDVLSNLSFRYPHSAPISAKIVLTEAEHPASKRRTTLIPAIARAVRPEHHRHVSCPLFTVQTQSTSNTQHVVTKDPLTPPNRVMKQPSTPPPAPKWTMPHPPSPKLTTQQPYTPPRTPPRCRSPTEDELFARVEKMRYERRNVESGVWNSSQAELFLAWQQEEKRRRSP